MARGLIAAHVRSDPFALQEQFHRLVGQPHVQLLMDQRIGNTVEVVFDRNVIVDVDLGFGQAASSEGLCRAGKKRDCSLTNQLSREPSSF